MPLAALNENGKLESLLLFFFFTVGCGRNPNLSDCWLGLAAIRNVFPQLFNSPTNQTMRKRRNLQSSSGPKKEEEEEHENVVVVEDIISNLPQDILHHIFSFLDMKQTIQATCLLSRRWRHFWVSIPTLKFTYNEARKHKLRNEFMDFVDRVLMFRGNSNIHEFALVTNNNINVKNRLNAWILASVIGNAQEITLNTHFPDKFHIHRCLLTCKSLTKLVLNAQSYRVSISLPDLITLPNLKTLSLKFVKFEDEYSTNRLFSNCPILESLTITYCQFPHINVNISSPLLQHLRLSKCRTRSNALDLGPVLETNFQLCAPNLRSFVWYNEMSIHCSPKNLSSLVKADVKIRVWEDSKLSKENHAPFMMNILRGLHNVEQLTLSASFLEVITGASYFLDSQPTTFCNLKCLKLMGTWRSIDSIHAISYLLKISPNIKTLFVQVSYSSDKMHPYWNPDEITSNSAKRGDYWKTVLSLQCLLNHLKYFELRDVTGRINELEFIEILLKNAVLLKKLLIIFQKTSYCKEKELEEGRRDKFREKVLIFPRASSRVKIMFKSSE